MKKTFLIILSALALSSSARAMDNSDTTLDLSCERRSGVIVSRLLKADHETVTELWLMQNGLEQLPQALERFTKLKELHIAYQPSLTEVSFKDNFKSLRVLILSNNSLKTLPPTIGLLTELIKLYAAHNQLQLLPAEIGNLKKLQVLSLVNNQLTQLPSTMANLTKLTILDLGGNKLLPDEIERIKHDLPQAIIDEDTSEQSHTN